MKNRIITDYLESLKEDNELDYIFPILLSAMGFRIVSTPRNSKGQPQHGKDIVAIGADSEGIIFRWYFELKGNGAKDITTANFNVSDGVRDSLLEAKYVAYENQSIPKFNELPVKIVFVHNGVLQTNAEPVFNGFVKKEFNNGEFERWDIERLTQLFSEHLFEECIFADDECYYLFKKTLVLIDAPGWNTSDVDKIIDIFLKRCPVGNKPNRRKINKTFAGLNLILAIILKNCEESGNLLPAKWSSDRIVLKIWTWILKNYKEKSNLYLKGFKKIYDLHLAIYSLYIQKLLPMALLFKGLYQPAGTESEKVCYPLRCSDFMNDLLYYLYSTEDGEHSFFSNHIHQVEMVMKIIKMNNGFDVPLLDNQSITLLLITRFVCCSILPNEKEIEIGNEYIDYIVRLCLNTIIRKREMDLFPELYNNIREVCASIYGKSEGYVDSSSMFLVVLIEIVACFNLKKIYEEIRTEIIKSKVNLQIPFPIFDEDFEVNFFDHHLHEEMSVETSIELPDTLEEFRKKFRIKYKSISFRTDNTDFRKLRLLAHIHYKTEWFPDFLDFGFLQLAKE